MPDALDLYGRYAPDQGIYKPPLEAAFDGHTVPSSARRQATKYSDPNDTGQYIRDLIAETNANVTVGPKPFAGSSFITPPAGWRSKTPERSLDDARRKYFYSALLDRYGAPQKTSSYNPYGAGITSYGENPESWSKLPEDISRELRKYATDVTRGETVDSAYEPSGFVGSGSPLHNFGTWLLAMPQGFYAASEGAANAVADGGYRTTPKEAWGKFDKAAETFFAPVTGLPGVSQYGSDQTSYWADRERYRQDQEGLAATDPNRDYRWISADADYDTRALADGYETEIRGDTGEELLNRYKADEILGETGTAVTGTIMDAMLNPLPPDLTGIRALAREGRNAAALGQLLFEFGPDSASLGYRYGMQP